VIQIGEKHMGKKIVVSLLATFVLASGCTASVSDSPRLPNFRR